jgi:hypothetical protein
VFLLAGWVGRRGCWWCVGEWGWYWCMLPSHASQAAPRPHSALAHPPTITQHPPCTQHPLTYIFPRTHRARSLMFPRCVRRSSVTRQCRWFVAFAPQLLLLLQNRGIHSAVNHTQTSEPHSSFDAPRERIPVREHSLHVVVGSSPKQLGACNKPRAQETDRAFSQRAVHLASRVGPAARAEAAEQRVGSQPTATYTEDAPLPHCHRRSHA